MAKKPASFSLSSTRAQLRNEIACMRDRVRAIEDCSTQLRTAFAIVEEVAKVAKLHDAFQWPNANVWAYGGPELSASFEVPCLSFKGGALPAVLEKALELGFEVKDTRDSAGQSFAYRCYEFTQRIHGVSVRLRINAIPLSDDDGATCRKVQVGTKMIEEPVFALVCE